MNGSKYEQVPSREDDVELEMRPIPSQYHTVTIGSGPVGLLATLAALKHSDGAKLHWVQTESKSLESESRCYGFNKMYLISLKNW